jgi:small subunit ribosomal protein S20
MTKKHASANQAKKRDRQNIKKRIINSAHKSRVHTAKRTLKEMIEKKIEATPEMIQNQLSTVFSLMDKGVKKGVFKRNKADRTKSRLSAKV